MVFDNRYKLLIESEQASQESIRITEEIVNLIEKKYQIKLDESNGASLVTHLAITIKKLNLKECLSEIPEIGMTEAFSYKEEMEFAGKLTGYLKESYQIDFNRSEIAFLAIHLRNISQHLERKEEGIIK
ncbi:MAG: PRD domain-containing protein [Anaerolineaceae bacterium]